MAAQTQPSVDLSDDRRGYIQASVITVLVLAIISTALRLVARRIQKIKYGASDYVVVVALVCGICEGATILAGLFLPEPFTGNAYLRRGTHYGFGRHVQTVSTPDLEKFLKASNTGYTIAWLMKYSSSSQPRYSTSSLSFSPSSPSFCSTVLSFLVSALRCTPKSLPLSSRLGQQPASSELYSAACQCKATGI